MKIYFGATTSKFDTYKENYYKIRKAIIDSGHIITRDWINMYKKELEHHPKKLLKTKSETKQVYQKAIKAFYQSDILITENTIPSFSNGHLLTLALQRNIPVLILLWEKRPKRYLKNSFIDGISSPNLTIREYNLMNVRNIVKVFLKKYDNYKERHRFHLVLDHTEYKYLDWASHEYKSSKTKLIRKYISKEIQRDKKYTKYLND